MNSPPAARGLKLWSHLRGVTDSATRIKRTSAVPIAGFIPGRPTIQDERGTLFSWPTELAETRARTWLPVLLPICVGLLASNLHTSLSDASSVGTHFLVSLVLIPVVIAGIRYGAFAAAGLAIAGGAAHALLGQFSGATPWSHIVAETL